LGPRLLLWVKARNRYAIASGPERNGKQLSPGERA
jgi:hypothetical protein